MSIEEVKKRKSLADYYYDNYRECYLKGELSKASEYIWGVLNELVYALGLLYGEKLSTHGKIVKFLEGLTSIYKEVKAEGIIAIQHMHANFHHDFMDKDMFEMDRQESEKLLNTLAEILDKELSSRKVKGGI